MTLLCENDLANVIVDQFGHEVKMVPVDEGHFTVEVEVAVSDQFLCWVISLGRGARITGPEDVVQKVKEIGKRLLEE